MKYTFCFRDVFYFSPPAAGRFSRSRLWGMQGGPARLYTTAQSRSDLLKPSRSMGTPRVSKGASMFCTQPCEFCCTSRTRHVAQLNTGQARKPSQGHIAQGTYVRSLVKLLLHHFFCIAPSSVRLAVVSSPLESASAAVRLVHYSFCPPVSLYSCPHKGHGPYCLLPFVCLSGCT